MNVTFCGIVFNGDHLLEQCILAVKSFGKVVFVEGPTRYYQKLGYTTSTDHTNEILHDLLGAENVYHGQFEEKDEESAATERLIPDTSDYVFWVDCDEVWRTEDIEKIFAILETNEFDAISFKADSFFGGFDYVLTGWERAFEVHRITRWKENPGWVTHRPPTVHAPDGIPWRNKYRLSHEDTERMGLTMPHYSYIYPTQVYAKAGYYDSYDNGLCIPNYFETVFLPWVVGDPRQRQAIEKKWEGVHNFNPGRRGACYTKRFEGRHPEIVERALPQLIARLDAEVSVARINMGNG